MKNPFPSVFSPNPADEHPQDTSEKPSWYLAWPFILGGATLALCFLIDRLA